jgi:hypothetical protein
MCRLILQNRLEEDRLADGLRIEPVIDLSVDDVEAPGQFGV